MEAEMLSHNKIQPAMWYLKVTADGHTEVAGVQSIFKGLSSESVHTGESKASATKPGL